MTLEAAIARKQAGVRRMELRQSRVQQRMADFVEDNPQVLQVALGKVRDMLLDPCCTSRTLYQEWVGILQDWTHEEVVTMLRDRSQETEQLRATAPFLPSMAS